MEVAIFYHAEVLATRSSTEAPIQLQAPSLPLPLLVEIGNRKTMESMNQLIFDLDIFVILLYLLSSCFVLLCRYTSSQLASYRLSTILWECMYTSMHILSWSISYAQLFDLALIVKLLRVWQHQSCELAFVFVCLLISGGRSKRESKILSVSLPSLSLLPPKINKNKQLALASFSGLGMRLGWLTRLDITNQRWSWW